MAKIKLKKNWKKILGLVVVVFGLVLTIGLISSLTGREKVSISSSAFSRGDLDASGEYVESETSIYTSELFECRGLTVTPEFESKVFYKIFFYNEDGIFINATEKTARTSEKYTGTVPELAKYARIAVYPKFTEDDSKIKFYEVISYANDLEIKVDRDQKFKVRDIYAEARKNVIKSIEDAPDAYADLDNDEVYFFKMHYVGYADAEDGGGVLSYKPDNFIYQGKEFGTVMFKCSDVKQYKFTFDEVSSRPYYIFFFSKDGGNVYNKRFMPLEGESIIFDVPENAAFSIVTVMPTDDTGVELPFVINEYLPR